MSSKISYEKKINMKLGFVISMYDEIDIVMETISCLKKNNCKIILIQSNPGNNNKIDPKICDAYEILPDLAGNKENYLKMTQSGVGEHYLIGAFAIPRNYSKGFTIAKNIDVDYVIGINGDTKITEITGIKKIIRNMKKSQKLIAGTRNIGFLMFNEQHELINFQDKYSTQIMPQFFIVDHNSVKNNLFCNIVTTNNYNTEQCIGDEIIRFSRENSLDFFDIFYSISEHAYPRNILGVEYNPDQVSKMPEFMENFLTNIRKRNGKKINLFLTKLAKLIEKFL